MSDAPAKILGMLLERVREIATTLQYPVAWPNRVYTPVNGQTYLAPTCSFLPAVAATLGDLGYNRLEGTLLIGVFSPINIGSIEPVTRACRIAAYFPRGLHLVGEVTVQLTRPPSVLSPVDGAGWTNVPVSIRWQCDAPNG